MADIYSSNKRLSGSENKHFYKLHNVLLEHCQNTTVMGDKNTTEWPISCPAGTVQVLLGIFICFLRFYIFGHCVFNWKNSIVHVLLCSVLLHFPQMLAFD